MKKKLWIVLLAGCFLCVASGALAADKTPVKLIGSAVLSGKVGALVETGWGFMDAQDYINEKGGVNGRKFEVLLEDGQYDVPVSVSLFNRVVESQPKNELFFHSGWQTGVLRAIAEKVSENHVVCIDGSMASTIFTDDVKEKYPYYFSCGVPYGEQCGMIFKYIKENRSWSLS